MTAIRLDSLVKRFGATTAVAGVDLEIAAGELFFLLGPSGCGKTTLLRMIAGFIEPTDGRIVFVGAGGDDRDVTGLPPNKRNTGMVFQSYALWPHMSVAQNVAYGLKVRKVAAAERDRRVREALARVRMEDYAERKPNQLSGGQQQRVALARALVVEPSVLLLDEPLSNLDAKLRLEMRSEIRRICKQAGITGVYVTHDQKEALSMADRIAVMELGRVVQTGTPRELYDRPASRFVADFLGESNFLDGTIESIDAGRATIETAAGRIVSAALPEGTAAGDAVTVSIRPEALSLVEDGAAPPAEGRTRLEGFLVERIYLGEQAQHLVRLPGEAVVKAMESNPRPFDVAHPGERHRVDGHVEVEQAPRLVLEVDAPHVVVLPAAPA